MLLELIVQNFRSIKERQEFSLASSTSDELDKNTFTPAALGVSPLLRSAAIYGANAAGKSNFILALSAMKRMVINSAKNSQRGSNLPVRSYKLCDQTVHEPTEFEVLFISDGVKYQYGFSATSERVVEEWLFAFPKGRPQRWFIRAYDESTKKYAWDFSSLFTGKKQVWSESTRENSLFLSTAVMLNNEQLKPVYDWFHSTLKIAGIAGWGDDYTAELCTTSEGKREVLTFLTSADLDISDLSVETNVLDKAFIEEHITSDVPDFLKDKMLEDLNGQKIIDIRTVHKSEQGTDVLFDLDEESDGTRKIFSFAGPWLDALKSGKVLFIDELHDSLHPKMVKFLVELFNSPKSNPHNAQLVFTTHETSILDQNVFRRDQIWFCKKEMNQETRLYPLTDFSPRKKVENLEKAYLSGRYGSLPVLSTLDLLEEINIGQR